MSTTYSVVANGLEVAGAYSRLSNASRWANLILKSLPAPVKVEIVAVHFLPQTRVAQVETVKTLTKE